MNPAKTRSSLATRVAPTLLAMALGLASTAATSNAYAQEASMATLEPIVFVSAAGDSVEAERGEFMVPENRSDRASRQISLAFVRFPSTSENPGSPIVYLAGGPGGSGIATARGRRFPLFMALREIGDVVAFDQRGTGASNHIPGCETEQRLPVDVAPTLEDAVALFEAAAADCVRVWEDAGVDLAGYTTVESARDLEALRQVLGAEKLSLWGISYGTHLAMAALKEMEGRVDRAILASAEGLDQTVKLPVRTDAYFDRLQAAIDAHPEAAARYPDVKAMIRRVLDRLRADPVVVTVPQGGGAEPVEFLMGALEVQLFTGFSLSDPPRIARVLGLYAAADQGNFTPIGLQVYRAIRREPVSLSGMSTAMDVASGISPGRLAEFESQAETALLGGVLNWPMPYLASAFEDLDLGPLFREGPETDVPTLLLSGTLDGRTYPESQREATAGFTNLTHVIIEDAGHNLFMVSPRVTETILAFMRGEPIPGTLAIELEGFGG